MSKGLEDFIKQNKNEFNDQEPEADLWPKIEKRLPGQAIANQPKKTFTLGFVLRVAALVMLVMGAGFIFYLQKQHQQPIDLARINPEYARQQMHYASEVESKRVELKTIAKSDPELYQEFNSEIIKMDSTYKKLNKELVASPNQERVLRAMIRNLQIQTELLNQQLEVIEQYNQTKKQENHGTKNI
ncbi:hypothetical protein [Mucilaginibacter arboris]|uniref:Anti-sigma factor n=1 Tax=Mucilaginibacter arboris TaxID=2682090 RepID=A0A7K1SVE4_9SPHI|nr:hypothetical protein [Mucilaginibacter arboris]MVN21319.1 hypothetical protein [Mucilaginibacter arboris]